MSKTRSKCPLFQSKPDLFPWLPLGSHHILPGNGDIYTSEHVNVERLFMYRDAISTSNLMDATPCYSCHCSTMPYKINAMVTAKLPLEWHDNLSEKPLHFHSDEL